jgi:hypothetical protein
VTIVTAMASKININAEEEKSSEERGIVEEDVSSDDDDDDDVSESDSCPSNAPSIILKHNYRCWKCKKIVITEEQERWDLDKIFSGCDYSTFITYAAEEEEDICESCEEAKKRKKCKTCNKEGCKECNSSDDDSEA